MRRGDGSLQASRVSLSAGLLMLFIAAANEPTMFLMLTEQDVSDMRGGRTKYVDRTATKGVKFDKVVLSVHANQAEIESVIKQAGHGKLLQGMPSPTPTVEQVVCNGCLGNMAAYLVLDGLCLACWRERARSLTYNDRVTK